MGFPMIYPSDKPCKKRCLYYGSRCKCNCRSTALLPAGKICGRAWCFHQAPGGVDGFGVASRVVALGEKHQARREKTDNEQNDFYASPPSANGDADQTDGTDKNGSCSRAWCFHQAPGGVDGFGVASRVVALGEKHQARREKTDNEQNDFYASPPSANGDADQTDGTDKNGSCGRAWCFHQAPSGGCDFGVASRVVALGGKHQARRENSG